MYFKYCIKFKICPRKCSCKFIPIDSYFMENRIFLVWYLFDWNLRENCHTQIALLLQQIHSIKNNSDKFLKENSSFYSRSCRLNLIKYLRSWVSFNLLYFDQSYRWVDGTFLQYFYFWKFLDKILSNIFVPEKMHFKLLSSIY